jgi:hypothetical protein
MVQGYDSHFVSKRFDVFDALRVKDLWVIGAYREARS